MATVVGESERTEPARPRNRLAVARALVGTTLKRGWNDRVLGLSAEAAFWQLISLPSMLLGVVGVIGYFGDDLGETRIRDLETSIVNGLKRAILPSAVDSTLTRPLDYVLHHGRAEVVSIGFIVALWTGSSAIATYVNTITIAYGLRHQRGAVRSRILALVIYLGFIVAGVILVPLMTLGRGAIVNLSPDRWRHTVDIVTAIGYWPTVVLVTIALLTTLYHVAVPVRTPWRRALPGAFVGLALWLVGSVLLRMWLEWAFRSTTTYGPFSAPVAVLAFLYLTALAVLLGAELNAEIDRLWPLQATEAARREEEAAAAAP